MELNIIKSEPKYLEFEIVGEEHSLPNALREILIADKDVEFTAYKSEHPQVGHPKLIIRTKSKKASEVLIKAVEKLKKDAEEFKAKLKAAKSK